MPRKLAQMIVAKAEFGLSEFVESGAGDLRKPNKKWRSQKGISQGVSIVSIGLMLIPVWMFAGVISGSGTAANEG